MLLCPVRDCRLALLRKASSFACERGHSFDVARSGYVNLLQPQERKSKNPGDTAVAVAARRRLHDRGVTEPLLGAIGELLDPVASDVVLDAGCGDGFYLGALAQAAEFAAYGIDISIPAVDAASKKYTACQWIVANADRAIPYADAAFSAVLSITARMNAPEFRRVLRPDGRLLVAIPAPDDLIELRGQGRDRAAQTIAAFAESFSVVEQRRVTAMADLDDEAVNDVLLSIYRPMQSRPITAMRVTLSLDLLLLRPS